MGNFEWDPEKESLNVEKHRFDFETASQIWVSQVIEKADERRDYRETRIIAAGEERLAAESRRERRTLVRKDPSKKKSRAVAERPRTDWVRVDALTDEDIA